MSQDICGVFAPNNLKMFVPVSLPFSQNCAPVSFKKLPLSLRKASEKKCIHVFICNLLAPSEHYAIQIYSEA